MRMKLTDRTVARLKSPASGRLDVWDQALPAFGIQVRANGGRSWLVAVRRPGKRTTSRIKIGDPATMPLADARARARELMRDPAALAIADDPDDSPAGSLTSDSPMRQVIAVFIEARKSQRRNRTWRDVERLLGHELGAWMDRPLASITDDHVKAVLRQAIARGSPATANLLWGNVRRMLAWAVEQKLIPISPAASVKRPSPTSEREHVLRDPELQAVWHGCDRLGWPFGPLVQLLVLTGQREGEVAAMRWSDLDLDAAQWELGAEQTKAARAHIVPLSTAAVAILRAQPDRTESEYVFASVRTKGARPVSGFSKVKRRLDRLSGTSGWTFHDLRRTLATGLAQLSVPPHVTEKILNHASSRVAGRMGAIYQRYDYLSERRAALELWATTVARIVATGSRGNVVQLHAS
jgi:integrase